MVKRICPICDQVMKGRHYCSTCRSWVKHPYIREVDYYLNQRHPDWEKECTYHETAKAPAEAGGRPLRGASPKGTKALSGEKAGTAARTAPSPGQRQKPGGESYGETIRRQAQERRRTMAGEREREKPSALSSLWVCLFLIAVLWVFSHMAQLIRAILMPLIGIYRLGF